MSILKRFKPKTNVTPKKITLTVVQSDLEALSRYAQMLGWTTRELVEAIVSEAADDATEELKKRGIE